MGRRQVRDAAADEPIAGDDGVAHESGDGRERDLWGDKKPGGRYLSRFRQYVVYPPLACDDRVRGVELLHGLLGQRDATSGHASIGPSGGLAFQFVMAAEPPVDEMVEPVLAGSRTTPARAASRGHEDVVSQARECPVQVPGQ
jgi:hypothetical protein